MDPEHPIGALAAELAQVFDAAGFSADGIAGHLGPEYTDALHLSLIHI